MMHQANLTAEGPPKKDLDIVPTVVVLVVCVCVKILIIAGLQICAARNGATETEESEGDKLSLSVTESYGAIGEDNSGEEKK